MEATARRNLMILAVMPTITAVVAERLTDDPAATNLLEELANRNYFTTRTQEPAPNYRFHPLFREALLESARREFSEAEFARIQLNAARCLAETGQPEQAATLLPRLGLRH